MIYYLMHIYGPLPAVTRGEDVTNDEVLNNLVRPSLEEMTSWIYSDLNSQ